MFYYNWCEYHVAMSCAGPVLLAALISSLHYLCCFTPTRLLSLIQIHRFHLCKHTNTHTDRWCHLGDSEMMSLSPWVGGGGGGGVCCHIYLLCNTSVPLTLQCDFSHFANWTDSSCEHRLWCLTRQLQFQLFEPHVVSPLLLSSTRLLCFFQISQSTTVGRCEFLSDSDGDKRSELVMTMPWVGVCLL